MIPYGKQEVTSEDINAVLEVLQSDFLTQGDKVPEFERAVASKVGANTAVAVNSATSALHIACVALGLGKGDTLWTSPNTFVASANCGLYCGADVDFVDIDPQTYNICTSALKTKLEQARKEARLPKILVVVHFSGQSCDMEAIAELGNEYGFRVIEDASHAIGGKYQGKYIGCCDYSDIVVFSYHPVKIITTGEGGMALTNDLSLGRQMSLLRSHGVTREPGELTGVVDGPWSYQQIELGYNYRMTDLQAALGLSQLSRLDDYVERRHKIADRYNRELKDLPLILPFQSEFGHSSYHLFVVLVKSEICGKTRKEIFTALRERGIGVNVHYIPVHTQPFYRQLGFDYGDFPSAEWFYESAISLPMFPTMIDDDINEVVHALRAVLSSE